MEDWNPEWASMPWKPWTDPAERYKVLPSFVIGEFIFIGLTFVTLVHAISSGRKYVAVWVSAFITGTVNDAIFMVLPMVDNFWQSQACIMLTPRMPLYIPCVYNVFMYSGFIAADCLKVPLIVGSCIAGIMGEAVYSPYDITGIKFLWWTWHDTDAPIRHRILGTPIGSSVWVITFTCMFYFILHSTLFRKKWSILSSLLVTAVFSTPLMMVHMATLQFITLESQGLPTHRSLYAVLIIYGIIILVGSRNSTPKETRVKSVNYLLLIGLIGYYSFLVFNMAAGKPEKHLSIGVHQEYGDCNITAPDITGHYRQVYLCRDTHGQDYELDCEDLCTELGVDCTDVSTSWYAVCGRRHSNKNKWLYSIAAICTTAALLYTYLLTMHACDKKTKRNSKQKVT